MRNAIAAVALGLLATAAWASGLAGNLDLNFDSDGVVEVEPLAGVSDMVVWNTAVDDDGSVYVVGEALDTNQGARRLVARKYDALGQQVSTYGGSGVAMPLAPSELQTGISAAVDADGQLLIAGSYIFDRVVPGRGKKTTTERVNTGVVLRLTDQGFLDTAFGPNEAGPEAGLVLLEDDRALLTTVSDITLLDDDGILVTGRAYVPGTSSGGGKKKKGGGSTTEANYAILLAKLLPDGDLEPNFRDGGIAIDNRSALDDGVSIGGTAVQSDGRIIVGSAATTPGAAFDVRQVYLRRYLATGALDPDFGQDGTGEVLLEDYLEDYTQVNGVPVAVDNAGGVLVGGAVSPDGSGGSLAGVVLRFLPDGKGLDPTFGQNGRFETNRGIEGGIRSIVALSDGSVVAAGPIWPNGLGGIAPEEYQILRLEASGQLDSTFGNGGYGETFAPSVGYRLEQRALAVDLNGNPVVAGNVYSLINGEPPLPPFLARNCGN